MDTTRLIDHLAAQALPIRPLARPWKRATFWLALSIPYVILIVVIMSPRPDLADQLANSRFLVEEAAAFLTAILAAVAAFSCIVPGRSRIVCLLPFIPLAVWLTSLGQTCLQNLRSLGISALSLRVDWDCLPAAALVGIVPAVAMVTMLRRGAPLYPRATLAMGALAVGALAQSGMQIYHVGDISFMVIVWHFGSVMVLAMIGAAAGRWLLRWPNALGGIVPAPYARRA